MTLTYESIIQILKQKNYRLTEIRLAIIETLTTHVHLVLSDIVGMLEKKFENVNLASVYNTIDLLIREHIVFTNSFDGKDIWYDLADNPSFHVVCDLCKKVIHMTDPEILQKIDLNNLSEVMANIGWEPVHFKMEGHGVCKECYGKTIEDSNQDDSFLKHNEV